MLRILHDGMGIVAAEQPPTTRSITANGKRHFLKWPYVVFVRNNFRFYVYASDKPLKGGNDHVSLLPLPNLYNDGSICMANLSWGCGLKACIDSFWNSEFKESELDKEYWYCKEAVKWKAGGTLDTWRPKGPLNEINELHDFPDTFPGYNDDVIRDRATTIWAAQRRPLGSEAIWLGAEAEILRDLYKKG